MEALPENAVRLHYDLKVHIDPATQWIAVSGSVIYHAQHDEEKVRFFLHHQLEVEELSGAKITGYQYEKDLVEPPPFAPQAGALDVYFDPPLRAGKTAAIQFEYDGRLDELPPAGINLMTINWVELGKEAAWYPMFYDGNLVELTYSLQVSCPEEYSPAGYGQTTQRSSTWGIQWNYPTSEILLAVGRDMQHALYESESNRVIFHAGRFSERAMQQMGEEMLWIMERLSGWYGPVRPAEFTLIESPRTTGGSYAAQGMIVIAGLSEADYLQQRPAYLRYLAHEAAHVWWRNAPTNTWEDWLNESFAEYSALMAVRERYGQEIFQRSLGRKREQAADLPALWQFKHELHPAPGGQSAVDRQLYQHGPLLLHALAEKIGNRQFLEVCRGMQWAGMRTTAQFLDILAELEGQPTRQWMEAQLRGE